MQGNIIYVVKKEKTNSNSVFSLYYNKAANNESYYFVFLRPFYIAKPFI